MKPGCLVKGLIISTILLAVIFYVFINKYDTLIEPVIDEFITDVISSELGDELASIRSSAEKDSLQKIIRETMENVNITINSAGEKTSKEISDMALQISQIAKDSIVTQDELKEFLKLSEKIKQNERSKKNRN